MRKSRNAFYPRDDVAFIGQIIERLRHFTFPSAVDDDDVYVAVPGGIAVACCLAANETAATGRVVVV